MIINKKTKQIIHLSIFNLALATINLFAKWLLKEELLGPQEPSLFNSLENQLSPWINEQSELEATQ